MVICCQVLMSHTYNPSYSGGRDQELWLEKKSQKTVGGASQGVGPEYLKKKKKKEKEIAILA
jgi:hypothetical protein